MTSNTHVFTSSTILRESLLPTLLPAVSNSNVLLHPSGQWEIAPLVKHALQGDRGLVLKTRAKHAAISSRLTKPFHFLNKPLVVQYEVRGRLVSLGRERCDYRRRSSSELPEELTD